MDFRSLIRHLTDENKTYESQVRTRRQTSYSHDLILHNDHDLTRPEPCFALVSFSDPDFWTLAENNDTNLTSSTLSSTLSDALSDAHTSPPYFQPRYCKICWILNLKSHALRDKEEVKYHMKAKHLKEIGDEDALTFWELNQWKRKHPGY